uniref:NEDD8-activating enzyme E1 regulatory subunit n=1 Tax=Globodera pallida TaxID=36090 RepID=A0A183C091_GLOPA
MNTEVLGQQQQRYDRQIRLWGDDGQLSIQQARICVFGSNALAAEILKSLVLAGIGSFHIIDKAVVNHADFGQNFFVEESALDGRTSKCLCNFLSLSHGIPFVYTSICGMLGYLRLSFREHYIWNSHAENAAYDLRLDSPFPELLKLANETHLDSMTHEQHSHTPYLLLYFKALDKWRKSYPEAKCATLFPDITAYNTRKEFEQILMQMRQPDDKGSLDEQNFIEAKQNLLKAMRWSKVPENVNKVLSDPKTLNVSVQTNGSSGALTMGKEWVEPFWIFATALREFIEKNGQQMPISGQLPDMTSDSKRYAQLLGVFRNKSMEDAAQLFAMAKDILTTRHSLLAAARTASSSSSNYVPSAVADSKSSTDESMNSTDDEALTTDESDDVSRMSTSDPIEHQNQSSMEYSVDEESVNESAAPSSLHMEENTITLERCQGFIKSASKIFVQYGTSLSAELNANLTSILKQIESADLNEVPPRVHPLSWYALLRATDRFRAINGRFPGCAVSSLKNDAKELKKIVRDLFAETQDVELISRQDELVPPEAIAEVCRYSGSEPHVVAAILGGCVAQEAIKLCTHQYVPVDNSLLFDAHSQQAVSFRVASSPNEGYRLRRSR